MCTYRQTYTYDTGTDALFLPSRCGGLSLLHHVVLAAFGGLPSKRRRTGAGSHPYNGMYGMQVYGALPPEARRQQAALFNGPPNQHSGDSSGSSGSSGSSCSDNGSGISGDRSSSSGSSASSAAMGRRSHSAPAQRQHRTGPDEPTEYGYHGSWVTSSTRVRQSSQSGSELSGSDSFGSGSTSGSGSAAFHHHQVLCASDAIGMGLNLNIRRVVFTSLHKYDGTAVRPLQPSEIRQIAGRAGRFASSHPTGYVTTLRPGDLPALHRALALRSETITRACLLPR
ncbi:hypothetical protein Vretimale_13239 [Volvox reticuliferus]|uniref:Helicase C-terminal domain-containing protein n=1 Tax=Volvox reticuliferus TaxID=1737510 RepID=A0A8J4GKS6_9CHLO|nr:hypothetical protein Vretifemale_14126 [Volvox reticuliferus]GIM09321.1 hypothetical protein Vretimale_13239 [Volvox reticuliferus]